MITALVIVTVSAIILIPQYRYDVFRRGQR